MKTGFFTPLTVRLAKPNGRLPPARKSPAVVAAFQDQLLLASHDACLYSLNKDGKEQWKFETQDRINCSPAIADRFTFVSGCDEHLRVIDLVGHKETHDVAMESFLIASPAIYDDMLYVGTHAGGRRGRQLEDGKNCLALQR